MNADTLEEAVRSILGGIGEDATREGLKDTPRRVAKMYREMFVGLTEEPPKLTVFPKDGNDEMVVVGKIDFWSMCEHHLVPFKGKAHIGYIPNESILGLSKFGRVVEHFARRPQVQERLTVQIAEHLYEALDPHGLIVVMQAEHLCMSMRGIQKPDHLTTTSAIRGKIDKQEFFDILRMQ